jgi:hypothetical protein
VDSDSNVQQVFVLRRTHATVLSTKHDSQFPLDNLQARTKSPTPMENSFVSQSIQVCAKLTLSVSKNRAVTNAYFATAFNTDPWRRNPTADVIDKFFIIVT